MSPSENRTTDLTTRISPAFLAQFAKDDHSLDSLKEYRILEGVCISQSTTPKEVRDKVGGEGTVFLSPTLSVLMKKEESRNIVPIFFYVEYQKRRDVKDKSGKKIIEKTQDKMSKIAKLSRDEKLREEPYGELDPKTNLPKYNYNYVECLNFCCVLYTPGSKDLTPITLSFFKGEHQTGKKFSTKIQGRKIDGIPVPLFMQVWKMSLGMHRNATQQEWWGFEFNEPENPEISQQEVEAYHKLHIELSELYKTASLSVDLMEEEVSGETVIEDERGM